MNYLRKVQLPNYFKRIGLGIAIASFIAMLLNKFLLESETARMATKYALLLGFLIMSISRERIEDELIIKLRMLSYSIAFMAAVGYAFFIPLADYVLHILFQGNAEPLKALSSFEILWFLLSIQVLYFELLKRRG